MQPVYLFDLASSQSRWLSIRQATVAGNIANANTPRFKALDVEPFVETLSQTKLAMAATAPGHMNFGEEEVRTGSIKKSESWSISHSGNSVSLEQEMLKAGEVSRTYSLNTAIIKSFHRMLTMSTKG